MLWPGLPGRPGCSFGSLSAEMAGD